MVTPSQMKIINKLFTVVKSHEGHVLNCRVCDVSILIKWSEFTPERLNDLLTKYATAHPRIYDLLMNHKPCTHEQ